MFVNQTQVQADLRYLLLELVTCELYPTLRMDVTSYHIYCIFNTHAHMYHSKITMVGDVVPYYTVTAVVPTLK